MLSKRYNFDGKEVIKLSKLQIQIRNQVATKINDKKYKFENIDCPICNNKEFELLSEKDRYGLYSPVVICKNCGLIFSNPRMDQDSYKEFYISEYRKLYLGNKKPSDKFFISQIKRGKNIYNYITQNLNYSFENKFVLEVGCGSGGILKYFQDKGCVIKGCDLDTEYLTYGKDHHQLDLEYGMLGEISLSENPDFIIYSHVMEHILDLNEELQKIKKILKPNGLLYIEVPSVKYLPQHLEYKSDFLKLLQNAHTFHFTLTSIKNLLHKNGFTFQYGDEAVHSIFQNETSNEFQLVNDFNDVLLSLKEAEKYRKIFLLNPFNIKKMIRRKIMTIIDFFHLREPIKRIVNKILHRKNDSLL